MTTYATLKSDIATYLARSDLDDITPTLVRLAESRIRKDVRVMAMENNATLTVDSQSVNLPDDYLAIRRFYMDDPVGYELDYLSPSEFWEMPHAYVVGKPRFYTIEANQFKFAPYPSSTMYAKLVYFKSFDSLSGNEDTNWLLTNHYDVYLYACLSEAKAFIEDDEQAGKWATAYSAAKDAVNTTNRRAVRGLSTVRVTSVP